MEEKRYNRGEIACIRTDSQQLSSLVVFPTQRGEAQLGLQSGFVKKCRHTLVDLSYHLPSVLGVLSIELWEPMKLHLIGQGFWQRNVSKEELRRLLLLDRICGAPRQRSPRGKQIRLIFLNLLILFLWDEMCTQMPLLGKPRTQVFRWATVLYRQSEAASSVNTMTNRC